MGGSSVVVVTDVPLLVLVVVTALAFDFTNGFHDTANAMATSIATGALKPKAAVLLSAVLNVVGAFLSLAVAATIASGIVEQDAVTLSVIFAGLAGGIVWNLVTWYLGLPSSSSHAIIGGLVGAVLAAAGTSGVIWSGLGRQGHHPGRRRAGRSGGRGPARHVAGLPHHPRRPRS